MHTFIFLVLMTPASAGSIWSITPMPNTDGGRGYGNNTGECIEVKTREPLNSTMETLSGGSQ